jgi:hypothetical protein
MIPAPAFKKWWNQSQTISIHCQEFLHKDSLCWHSVELFLTPWSTLQNVPQIDSNDWSHFQKKMISFIILRMLFEYINAILVKACLPPLHVLIGILYSTPTFFPPLVIVTDKYELLSSKNWQEKSREQIEDKNVFRNGNHFHNLANNMTWFHPVWNTVWHFTWAWYLP